MSKNVYSKKGITTSNKLGQHPALPTMRRLMNAVPGLGSKTLGIKKKK